MPSESEEIPSKARAVAEKLHRHFFPGVLDACEAREERERLANPALRWYRPDGTYEVLASPEEVVARRVKAAKALEIMKAALEYIGHFDGSALSAAKTLHYDMAGHAQVALQKVAEL